MIGRTTGTRNERVTADTIAAAGIAVLVVLHRPWLAANPDQERWCLDRLKGIEIEAPDDADTPHSVLDTYTESFVGEAAMLCCRRRMLNGFANWQPGGLWPSTTHRREL